MADEKSGQDESKKDTVRINLPAGLAGRPAASPAKPDADTKTTIEIKVPGTAPRPMTETAPTVLPSNLTEDEAKKETAVMGKATVPPKPKSDTSRVQVTAAKPAVPEMPRPTVKLRREDEAPKPGVAVAAPPAAPATAPKPATVASGPGGLDVALSVLALAASVAVLIYLYMVTQPPV